MKNNTMKTVLAVVLLLAMAAVVTYQFGRLFKKPAEEPTPPPAIAQEKAPAAPAGETAKAPVPATGSPSQPAAQPEPVKAGEPVPAQPVKAGEPAAAPAKPAAQTSKTEELPKISFMDEKIDAAFANSRFFMVNSVLPAGNPFQPPLVPVPMRKAPGMPGQLPGLTTPNGSTPSMAFTPPGVKPGEIPVLPLPSETLGEPISVTLTGISQSGNNATALFTITKGTAVETVMAHPGWIIGNDYVFVGAVNGKAKVFNRKTNRVIQLATGETI
jgi:hypothetical protein